VNAAGPVDEHPDQIGSPPPVWDFVPVGEILGLPASAGSSSGSRLAAVWTDAVGEEVARNAQPRTLRQGRLVVATSSSVWAHALQLMAGQIVERLNGALGDEAVREVLFRPAGYDPGGGQGAPKALGVPRPTGGEGQAGVGPAASPGPRRALTAEEAAAVAAAKEEACDPELGELIARAMRSYWERGTAAPEG
jgi:hypothetical protein